MNNHIIQKTILDLQYNGSRDGFALQKQVSEWAYSELIKTIEEQLEKISQTDSIIRIDRLDMEIEIDAQENWLSNASNKIAEQLNKSLSENLSTKSEASGVLQL